MVECPSGRRHADGRCVTSGRRGCKRTPPQPEPQTPLDHRGDRYKMDHISRKTIADGRSLDLPLDQDAEDSKLTDACISAINEAVENLRQLSGAEQTAKEVSSPAQTASPQVLSQPHAKTEQAEQLRDVPRKGRHLNGTGNPPPRRNRRPRSTMPTCLSSRPSTIMMDRSVKTNAGR